MVIADDYTGAMDTGVQFSKKGISTLVTTNTLLDLGQIGNKLEVLVVDIESRHDAPEIASKKVREICKRAFSAKIPYLYKKTDSALRGNIGAELTAFLETLNINELIFVPAFPNCQRIVIDGTLYIEGIPVKETVFGHDQYSPIRHSFIPDIIREQSSCAVSLAKPGENREKLDEMHITVFDTESNLDLQIISNHVQTCQQSIAFAGCAGFAEFLPEIYNLNQHDISQKTLVKDMLVVSGSINDITVQQLRHAKQCGFDVITLTPEQKMEASYWSSVRGQKFIDSLKAQLVKNHIVIIGPISSHEDLDLANNYAIEHSISPEEIRTRTMNNLGELVKFLLHVLPIEPLVVFGGDTLMSITSKLESYGVLPGTEISSGTVIGALVGGRYENLTIISKSGGFGSLNIIQDIIDYLNNNYRKMFRFGANKHRDS